MKTNSTMQTTVVLLLFLNLALSNTATQNQPPPYIPTDKIFLNSGASIEDPSTDGRNWISDGQLKYCPPYSEMSSPSKASHQDPSVTQVPFMTARIIRSTFTCKFPVSIGPKFIRLYFYPANYSGLNISSSFFTVTANGYILLNNFSAYLTVSAMQPSAAFLVKEFIITVWDNQEVINLTFIPSPSSFAFINGIEIVSMPTNLYTKDMNFGYRFVIVDNYNQFNFDNTTSMETVCRLNVGGGLINGGKDTGMFRSWVDDTNYIFEYPGYVHTVPENVKIKYSNDTPDYVAPEDVYVSHRTMDPDSSINKNYNLTWNFSVDSGFNYLLRLHFCENEQEITKPNQRVFRIFINNMTAEEEADVILWSKGNSIPVYKDYVLFVPKGSQSKQDLWLALHPNTDVSSSYNNAILNGLEIFKLNNSDGSLAGSNPERIMVPPSPDQHSILQKRTNSKRSSLVTTIVGVVAGVILFAFCLVLFFFIYRRKKKAKDTSRHKRFWQWLLVSQSSETESITDFAIPLPTDLCRQFTMAEIKAATRNFKDENIIGSGGFGTVYKGNIQNSLSPVAIKRLDLLSRQGIREFHTEIKMMSKLRHLHLVSLIGYCDDQGDMILVYEHMPNGTLQDHLYRTNSPPLTWKQRLQICIGAARGLHYLHTGSKHSIIHRDVKSSNILLDKNWVAKVSDFGLSKTGPTGEDQTHVTTVVRGSLGYLDPEYYRRQQLTEKSDVYSFGVVLFEVLCGRPSIVSSLPREQMNLVQWARNCYKRETLDQIIDSHLKGDITTVSLNKFGELAESCVRDNPTERPTMGDIVWNLEFALQLQESAEKNVNGGDVVSDDYKDTSVHCEEVTTTGDDDDLFIFSSGPMPNSRSTVSFGERSTSNVRTETASSGNVRSETIFSEIMNPEGK